MSATNVHKAAKFSPECRAFLEAPRFGVLATINSNGTPQQTTMWYELRGDNIMMNTAAGRVKEHNLLRDPRVSLCVHDGYSYITLRGRVELDYDPEVAQADIKALAVRYDGEESGERQAAEKFRKQRRITINMTIESIDDQL